MISKYIVPGIWLTMVENLKLVRTSRGREFGQYCNFVVPDKLQCGEVVNSLEE